MCSYLGCFVSFHCIFTECRRILFTTDVSSQWNKNSPNHLTMMVNLLEDNCKIHENVSLRIHQEINDLKSQREEKKNPVHTLIFLLLWGFYRSLWKGQPDGWKLNQNTGGSGSHQSSCHIVTLASCMSENWFFWSIKTQNTLMDCDLWIGTVPSHKTKRSSIKFLFFTYLEETPRKLEIRSDMFLFSTYLIF